MADEQKPLSVGDILDQLVRPPLTRSFEAKPVRPESLKPEPLKQELPKSESSELPLPSSKPATELVFKIPELGKTGVPIPSLPGQISKKDQPSEARFLIRTMRDDLIGLRQGQQLTGVEIRKPLPSLSTGKAVAPPPSSFSKTPVTAAEAKKGFGGFKWPFIGRVRPQEPAPQPGKPAHIHEEVRIADKDSAPAFLGAPLPKKIKKPEEEKVEYGTIARVIGSGMTTGIVTTVLIAIAAYALIYYFFIRQEEAAIITPSPIPTRSRTVAEINELDTIFKAISVSSVFQIPADNNKVGTEFKSFILGETLAKKEIRKLKARSSAGQDIASFFELLSKLFVNYPGELVNIVKTDSALLLYGQEEIFGVQDETSKRVVMIVEVKDMNKTTEAMKEWEKSIANDIKHIFDIDPAKQASVDFIDNEREGIRIRYKNFPLPDRSIDYAIVTSLTGRYYLVLSNSRESMYYPIDKIRGL